MMAWIMVAICLVLCVGALMVGHRRDPGSSSVPLPRRPRSGRPLDGPTGPTGPDVERIDPADRPPELLSSGGGRMPRLMIWSVSRADDRSGDESRDPGDR